MTEEEVERPVGVTGAGRKERYPMESGRSTSIAPYCLRPLSSLPTVLPGRLKGSRGLTIVELLITITIVALLAGIGTPIFSGYIQKARTTKAIADIRNTLEVGINLYEFSNNTLPVTLDDIGKGQILDPWGNTYEYLNFAAAGPSWTGKARKDQFLVPLNSDYDLYSKGPDGKSVSPLTAKASRDDIIRANDGAYVGLASDY